ncbi:hypothetical protein [Mesorhizobium sp.]|uniref:hypothetical protein n=1 Tax=Mesorhizobium sp. TaxID=1871066 RepID=UPI000FEA480C|nr:hypothetical protein [Mesorhizobium sp.]RWD70202.1 MAG: hypothetical protein EOS37_15480 [Mesorhizobium sp.]
MLTPPEVLADDAAIVRDVETSVARIKSEIHDAEHFLRDTLVHAGGVAADALARQTREKIAMLNADLIEAEAILEAVQARAGQE